MSRCRFAVETNILTIAGFVVKIQLIGTHPYFSQFVMSGISIHINTACADKKEDFYV